MSRLNYVVVNQKNRLNDALLYLFLQENICSGVQIFPWRNEPVHEISQQFDILTSVDSDEPVQPPFKLRDPNDVWSVA